MLIFTQLIFICWFIFICYWIFSAIGVKKNIKDHSWWKGAGIRLGIFIILLLLARATPLGHFFQPTFRQFYIRNGLTASSNFMLDSIGIVLAVVGVALAIWARVHLGKNWGMPMSVKEKPDLITSGPYAYVRHPIYTGMLMAMLGSACVDGLFWIIPFVLGSVYFLYSAKEEEKLMIKQFPDKYPAYKKRTKMLIPFLY